MSFPETPNSVGFPSDAAGPSPLCNGVVGDGTIIGVATEVCFFRVMDDKNRVVTKYLLNPVVYDLDFRGVVLVVLVNLPEDVYYYNIRLRCVQDSPQGFSTFLVRDHAWELKYFGIGQKKVIGQSDPPFAQFLHPIPPDHFAGIKLDIEYGMARCVIKAEHVVTSCEIYPYLQSKE